jgi:hypothetical protein
MLARDTIPGDVVEKQFLASLRESAADLPSSEDAAKRSLDELAERCARDLGLDAHSLQFLLAKGAMHRHYEPFLQMKNEWRQRLRRLPRRARGRPRIVAVLCEGQAVRSFLYTGVLKKMADWADLCVLSSFDIEADIAVLGPNVRYFPVPAIRRSRFDVMVMYLGYLHTDSHTNKRMVERLNESLKTAIADGCEIGGSVRVWQIASELPSVTDYVKAYCWSLRFFAQAYSLNECASLLNELEPDMLFNSSTVGWSSRLWTRAAALAGIPVVANVISWDNMSTKTLVDEFADTFLIWGEEMDEDFATSLPFLRPKPRMIVGSPQFEPIIKRQGLVSR